jgi:glyoxylase-like metal-dependent hydrolase (beta-lactamase superfamily II)
VWRDAITAASGVTLALVLLGDFEIHLLRAASWRTDGGTAFGVVPKVLWSREKPPDDDNLIEAACVSAVVRHRGRTIVCETGIGTKLSEKRAQQARVREPEGLLRSLQRLGIRPDEVDAVITTHLHWDHAGGFTRRSADGQLQLTFPKARHFVQRAEWDFALDPDPRSRAGYFADDFLPAAESGLVDFVEGDAEILPGVEVHLTGGHTPGHQTVLFRAGELACCLAGDLVMMRPHLRVPWNMSADLDVLRVIREKQRLLADAARHRWLLVLGHEVDSPAGYLEPTGEWTPEPQLDPVVDDV